MTQTMTITVAVQFMYVWACIVQVLLTDQNDRFKKKTAMKKNRPHPVSNAC